MIFQTLFFKNQVQIDKGSVHILRNAWLIFVFFHFQSQTEVDCAEVLRLRDMGISFVNKEDLYPQLRKDKKAAEIEQPSFFHPKAASDPFQNSPSTSSSTTEYRYARYIDYIPFKNFSATSASNPGLIEWK